MPGCPPTPTSVGPVTDTAVLDVVDNPSSRSARLSGGLFMTGMATFALLYAPQPILARLATDYRLNPTSASLVLSVSTLGLMIGVVPVAVITRAWDGRRVILTSLTTATVLAWAGSMSPSWPLLLLLRGLEGIALSAVPATALAYATAAAGLSRTGQISGLYIAGTTLGGLCGRVVGGALGDLGGWQTSASGVALLAGISTLMAWRLLPLEQRSSWSDRRAREVTRPWAAFAALWREADPFHLRLCLIAALLMTSFVATYNTMTFRLVQAPYLLSASAIGLIFLVYVAGTFASAIAGRLADIVPRKTLIAAFSVLMTVGVVVMSDRPLSQVVIGAALLTAGFFAAHGVANGWVGLAPSHHRRTATARYTVWYYAGSTLGGPLGGLVFDLGGWLATAVLIGTLGLVSAGVAMTMPSPVPCGAHRGH